MTSFVAERAITPVPARPTASHIPEQPMTGAIPGASQAQIFFTLQVSDYSLL